MDRRIVKILKAIPANLLEKDLLILFIVNVIFVLNLVNIWSEWDAASGSAFAWASIALGALCLIFLPIWYVYCKNLDDTK